MPASSNPQSTDDQCEQCHNTYSLIRRKKTCAVCHQSYCTNCTSRDPNHSYRICTICQLISNSSTTDDQLLELKVKHLRLYLQAKNIAHGTCTEKKELVDLVKQNRHLPFTNLFNPQIQTSQGAVGGTTTQPPPPPPPPKSGPFTNLQSTVSSFTSQMNNFASNIQDYVTNTVSDAINSTLGDELSPSPPPPNNPNRRPANHRSTSSGNSARTTNNQQQPRRPPPSQSTTSSTNQRTRQKSLSEIKNEDNIEDLNIRELKEILAANFVDFKGCVEKSELIEKVRRLYRDRQNEKIKAKELDDLGASDTELCKICMDAIADCVFLDCGHMVTCVKCGKLLAECPICRLNIVRVVRVFKS